MSSKGKLTIYVDCIRKMGSTLLRGHNTNTVEAAYYNRG